MSRRRLVPLCAAALAGLLVGGTSAGAVPAPAPAPAPAAVEPAPGPHGIIDVEHLMKDVDCDDAQLTGPAATSTAHVTGGEPVSLDALVLVDVADGAQIASIRSRNKRAAAEQELFARIRESLLVGVQSYDPLEISLKYDDFALLQPLEGGVARERTDDAREIIELAKQQLGGRRPAHVDIVYVVTDVDIQVPGIGYAVAGLADCIGGVALADRAFAVGETGVLAGDEGIGIGPVSFYKDLTAKIGAHEIGHLLGGHHHYQECGTPAVVAASRGELGPCTIMTNAVDFQTLPFSKLNGVVVRGHAETWAAGN